MTGLEALASVQYATVQGNRLAVVDLDDWEAITEEERTVDVLGGRLRPPYGYGDLGDLIAEVE